MIEQIIFLALGAILAYFSRRDIPISGNSTLLEATKMIRRQSPFGYYWGLLLTGTGAMTIVTESWSLLGGSPNRTLQFTFPLILTIFHYFLDRYQDTKIKCNDGKQI